MSDSSKNNTKKQNKKNDNQVSKGKLKRLKIEDRFKGSFYYYAIGKRKTAIAVVRLYKDGNGSFFVNNTNIDDYFSGTDLEKSLLPLKLFFGDISAFDLNIKVIGGGKTSQAEAVRHGLSRAILVLSPEKRIDIKKTGLLTRDARKKERKKPGLISARKRPQWSKR